MKRVFIAGALSSKDSTDRTPSQVVVDYIYNIHRMCGVASSVRFAGYAPFIPGADILAGIVSGLWNESDYRDTSMEFLKVCDCVLVISDSWGVQQEVKEAKRLGIPIYYSFDELIANE